MKVNIDIFSVILRHMIAVNLQTINFSIMCFWNQLGK